MYSESYASGARRRVCWGAHVSSRRGAYPHALGPVVTADPQSLGAERPTNNNGEISAFNHALTRVLDSFVLSAPGRMKVSIVN